MKIKCPTCGSKNVYLFDEEWFGSIENEWIEGQAVCSCLSCEKDTKVYFSVKSEYAEVES